jgi:hypothetical protein
MGQQLFGNTYRLRLADDGNGVDQDIEFEANGADSALSLARQYVGARAATLFENGEKLAELKYVNGFWEVS